MAPNDGEARDAPPPTLHFLATDDLVDLPVPALGKNIRTKPNESAERRVRAESDHPINTCEGCDDFLAGRGGLNRTSRAL